MQTPELVEVLHKTVAATYVALGQTEGKTLLPLPPDDMLAYSAGARSKENDRMHVLETSVVTWSDQIKGVIKTDFESVLLLNPSALQPRERPAPQNERPPKGVALRAGRPRLAHRGGGEERRRVACVEERLEEPN